MTRYDVTLDSMVSIEMQEDPNEEGFEVAKAKARVAFLTLLTGGNFDILLEKVKINPTWSPKMLLIPVSTPAEKVVRMVDRP